MTLSSGWQSYHPEGFMSACVRLRSKKKASVGKRRPSRKLGLCSLLLRSLFNRIKNARSGLLHVLKALQKQLGVPSVQAEVILSRRARFRPDGRANNVRDGLRFRLADPLIGIGAALSESHGRRRP